MFTSLAALLASYFLVFLVELPEKRRLIRDELKVCPRSIYYQGLQDPLLTSFVYSLVSQENDLGEATSSFLSSSLFIWLLPFMWRGRHTRYTLDTLGAIPLESRAQECRDPLLRALEGIPMKMEGYATEGKEVPTGVHAEADQGRNKPSVPAPLVLAAINPHRLLLASFRAFGGMLLLPLLPRAILLAATFCQPFLVNEIITVVQDSGAGDSDGKGWYIVGGFVCVYG